MSPQLFVGTSSWSFPGWSGLVYDRDYAQSELARYGLVAYAAHPVLNGVSIDRTFYRPMLAEDFRAYRSAVSNDFRFIVKAHQACTLHQFRDAPSANPHFLDADYAREMVIGPALDGLGATLGAIVFQFPPQSLSSVGGFSATLERLDRFLGALPVGPTYALEFRDSTWLTDEYRDILMKHDVRHCICVHPRMPRPRAQWRFAGAVKGPTIVRWNLGHGLEYEEAKRSYAPFDRLAAPDPITRREVANICLRSIAFEQPVFVMINNKAEGCAPLSAISLVEEVIALQGE